MDDITNIENDECLDWWEDFFDEKGNIPTDKSSNNIENRFTKRSKCDRIKAHDRAMGILGM